MLMRETAALDAEGAALDRGAEALRDQQAAQADAGSPPPRPERR